MKTTSADRTRDAENSLAQGDTSRAIKLLQRNVDAPDATVNDFATLGWLYRSRGSITARQSSQRILELGLMHNPDDPVILTELGKTYYAQTFYGDAERCFSRVLELDGDHCEAEYYLGLNAYRKWKHVQTYDHHLFTTLTHMRSVMRCDPEKTDAYFMFAFSSYILGDTAQCISTCDRYLEHHPPAANILFLRGTIAYEHADYESAWDYFTDGLNILDDDDRQSYLDIGLLIFGDEKQMYDWASKDEKKDLCRVYWVQNDPDPTTPVNERLLEHLYRTYLAEVLFAMPRLDIRGWDAERGKAVIKFGQPTDIRSTLDSRDFADGRTEIWSYLSAPGGRGFILYFRDEYLNGNYTIPMDYAYSVAGQTLYKDPPVTETTPDIALVPGAIDVFAFRESSIESKVYVAFTVDPDSLAYHLVPWQPEAYYVRTAFYDSDGRPQTFHADTLDGNALPIPPRSRTSYSLVRSFDLPFHSYTVAFCLEDNEANTQALFWSETNTVKYLSSDLTLSDILLWHTPPDTDTWPIIARPDGYFVPNPSRKYRHGEDLRLYLEVYNLGLSARRSSYEITYSVFEARRPANPWVRIGRGIKWLLQMDTSPNPVMSQTFARTSDGYEASEQLAIDIESLKPGEYVLSVEVNDQTSGDVASVSKSFTKISDRQD
ncbi:MAG: GWxTD domain-containing protein [Candidatus Latescibacterota bacterium]|nr:MAG: GWxTD domain-containing protein [Candidatus Latescibacterota bacterium]